MYTVIQLGTVVGIFPHFFEAWLYASLDATGTCHIKGDHQQWIVHPLYDPSKRAVH